MRSSIRSGRLASVGPAPGSRRRRRRSGESGASASQCAPGRAARASPNVGRGSRRSCSVGDERRDLAVELDGRGEQEQLPLERRQPEQPREAVDAGSNPSAARRVGGAGAVAERLEQRAHVLELARRAATARARRRSARARRRPPSCRHRHGLRGVERRRLGGAVDEQALDAVDRQPHPLRARRDVAELERERRGRRRVRLGERRCRRRASAARPAPDGPAASRRA